MGNTLFAILFASLVISLLLFLLYLASIFYKLCALRQNETLMSSLYHVQLGSRNSLNATDPDGETDTTTLIVPPSDQDENSSTSEISALGKESPQTRDDNSFFQLPLHKRSTYYKFSVVDDFNEFEDLPASRVPTHLATPHSTRKSGHRAAHQHDCESQRHNWKQEVAKMLVDNVDCRYIKGQSRVIIPKIVVNQYYEEEIEMETFRPPSDDGNRKEVLI